MDNGNPSITVIGKQVVHDYQQPSTLFSTLRRAKTKTMGAITALRGPEPDGEWAAQVQEREDIPGATTGERRGS